MNQNDEYYFGLLMEGRLDLMHLPSGAVAWLWQYHRPQAQVDSAARFASVAKQNGDAVISSALLRADHNVLVLHTESGMRVSVYPDGGLGTNGEPISPEMIDSIFSPMPDMEIAPEAGAIDPMPADLDVAGGPPGPADTFI